MSRVLLCTFTILLLINFSYKINILERNRGGKHTNEKCDKKN